MSAIINAIINTVNLPLTSKAFTKETAKYAILNGDFGLVDIRANNVVLDMSDMSRDEIFGCLRDMAIKTPWNKGGFQKWNRTSYISEEVVKSLISWPRSDNEITVYNGRDSIHLSREEGDKVYRVEVWSR